ncbi:MAG: hypothetical protein E6X17_06815 [Sporomusaceae bacterium]|nr:hypothetical protein [Sporomusaceae bacterium]
MENCRPKYKFPNLNGYLRAATSSVKIISIDYFTALDAKSKIYCK